MIARGHMDAKTGLPIWSSIMVMYPFSENPRKLAAIKYEGYQKGCALMPLGFIGISVSVSVVYWKSAQSLSRNYPEWVCADVLVARV